MIAVFAFSGRDFDEFHGRPKNIFIRIRDVNDIRGRSFIGIIKLPNWYNGDGRMLDAHDILLTRQPNLFI